MKIILVELGNKTGSHCLDEREWLKLLISVQSSCSNSTTSISLAARPGRKACWPALDALEKCLFIAAHRARDAYHAVYRSNV